MDAASQYALAYALTTTAGLRGFLALLAASAAMHFGWIHPTADYAWLGSDGATIVLAIFALLEFAADKVPAVDHMLQIASFAVRPVAAAILVGATVHDASPAQTYAMMALGAINALFVNGSAAAVRAGSTATTFGLGNVLLSFVEDGVAFGGIAIAFARPVLAAVLAVLFVIALFVVARFVVRGVRAMVPRRER